MWRVVSLKLQRTPCHTPSAALETEVLSTSTTKCRNNFQTFHFALAIHRQKNCRRLDKNLCILRRQWLWYTSAFCQGTTWDLTWHYLFYLNYIVYFIFLVSLCVLAIVGKHPTLEKLDAQNIAACENQGKQRAFNYHWKSIKTFFGQKITGDDAKDKKFDWNTISKKRF